MTATPLTGFFCTTGSSHTRKQGAFHGKLRPVSDPRDDELFKGPTLDANGRLENRFEKVEAPAPLPAPPPAEETLELAERGPKVHEPRIENFRDDPAPVKQRSGALKLVIGLLVLAVAAGVAFVVLQPKLELPIPDGVREVGIVREVLRPPDAAPVIITSEPAGATITIGDTVVGQTPWAGENRWIGETKVVLQLKGFRVWEGQLTGGKAITVDAQLKR